MRDLGLDSKFFYGLLALFAVVYLFTFPSGWLISDEYTYINQAIAIAQGDVSLSYFDAISKEEIFYRFSPYSLGNSFWIALWVKLFGVQNIYLGSLFAIFTGVLLLLRTVKHEHTLVAALGFTFLYPSLAFFSASAMSSIPSFLLVCLFIWFLFSKNESHKKWFWLTALASFSFWIRETNIVLLGGICLIHFLQDRRWFLYYFVGAVVGMLPRLISSYFFYGDPFYYLLAESFSISNIQNNYLIYGILTLICMPFGLFFLAKYKGRYSLPIVVSSFLFMGLYLTYSFNASGYSGFQKGVILMGRFLMPILPFFVLSLAWYFRNWRVDKRLIILFFVFVSIVMTGMKYKVYQEGQLHKSISNHIYNQYENDHVFYDLSRRTNIVRYLNPMHGQFANQADMTKLIDEDYTKKVLKMYENVYIIQTLNNENQTKSELTKSISDIVENAHKAYDITEVENIKIKPGLNIQVLKFKKRDE